MRLIISILYFFVVGSVIFLWSLHNGLEPFHEFFEPSQLSDDDFVRNLFINPESESRLQLIFSIAILLLSLAYGFLIIFPVQIITRKLLRIRNGLIYILIFGVLGGAISAAFLYFFEPAINMEFIPKEFRYFLNQTFETASYQTVNFLILFMPASTALLFAFLKWLRYKKLEQKTSPNVSFSR